jgi:hypothetical protein
MGEDRRLETDARPHQMDPKHETCIITIQL